MKLRGCACLLASGFLFLAAQADARSVAIRCTSEPEASTAEAVTRLRGELLAMGMQAVVQEVPATSQQPARDGRARSLYDADAVMDVSANAADLVVEIWIRAEAGEPFRWVTLTEERRTQNAPEKLAIRAAEALHSRFVEADLTPGTAHASATEATAVNLPAIPVVADAPRASELPTSVSRSPRLAVGGVVLAPTRGFSPSIMPLLRLEWPLWASLSPYISVAGLGNESNVAGADGGASMSWSYGVIGASYYFAELGMLEPFMAVAVGAQYSSIEGRAEAPLQVHDTQRWVGLSELSLGAMVPLSPRYYLTIAGHAQFTAPSIVVHVLDDVAAVSGRPNWGGSFAAGVWL